MATERITITFDKGGSFRGASAQDFDGHLIPVDAETLAKFSPGFALAEQLAATQSAYQEIEAEREAIIMEAAKANGDPTALMAIVERIAKPFVQQKEEAVKAAELAQADELETKAAEIRAKYEK